MRLFLLRKPLGQFHVNDSFLCLCGPTAGASSVCGPKLSHGMGWAAPATEKEMTTGGKAKAFVVRGAKWLEVLSAHAGRRHLTTAARNSDGRCCKRRRWRGPNCGCGHRIEAQRGPAARKLNPVAHA